MKFLALCYLLTNVSAGIIVQRDLATIKGVMATIGTDLVGLDNAVKSFSGDPSALLTASNALINDLKNGKTTVDPTGPLSLSDSLGLQAPAKDLQTKGDTLVTDIKAKKSALAAAGLCGVTFIQASSINTNGQALINTVVSKVPQDAQSIAKSIVAPLLKALQDAQDAFSPEQCQDGGSPPVSSTPVTSTPPTSTPPVSTPPPVSSTPTPTAPPSSTPTLPGGGGSTCPAAPTITVTTTDTKGCTATPTCTSSAPVTVTTTKKACPAGSQLPW